MTPWTDIIVDRKAEAAPHPGATQVKDVTQQLADALRRGEEKLDWLQQQNSPEQFSDGVPMVPLHCVEDVLQPFRAALTAFEASRAAPAEDVVERVAKRICASIAADEDEDPCSCDVDGSTCCAMDLFGAQARAALSALPARDEGLREGAIGLCAAIDNLWNHPDLVRVRSEIPESIKLNISRHQMQVRNKLAAPAQRDDGWMPIETAPKDGTRVMLWMEPVNDARFVVSDGPHAVVGNWVVWSEVGKREGMRDGWSWYGSAMHSPTHWRPLPAPPAPAQEPRS